MIALDTNILAYAVTASDIKGRHEAAIDLLAALASTGAVVPLPVLGEFFNACRRRVLTSVETAQDRVGLWLDVYDCPAAQAEDYLTASQLSADYQLQYFDALIITVAARLGAKLLLSEDMQDGLEVAGLRIVNPFVAANQSVIVDWLGSAL